MQVKSKGFNVKQANDKLMMWINIVLWGIVLPVISRFN